MTRPAKFTYQTRTDKVAKRIGDETAQIGWLIAQAGREATVELLSGMRTGKLYKKPGTNVWYRASAPGEPPAVMFGDLRRSIKPEVEVVARVVKSKWGSDMLKAPRLEAGDLSVNLKPRPFIEPSIKKAWPKIERILQRKWW